MTQEAATSLVVNARDPEEIRVALVGEDRRILDLRQARAGRQTRVGNLYLGVVRQVEAGLDAAFVDFGEGRSGFLHVGNVHPGYAEAAGDPFLVASSPTAAAEVVADAEPEAAEPAGPAPAPVGIAHLLREGQRIVVQVLRDAVRGKGATLTTFVSVAGRLLVLMPSLGRVGVSRRIQDDEERSRLRTAVEGLDLPEQMGVIARTAAAGSTKGELRRDLRHLLLLWEKARRARPGGGEPALLLAEDSPAVRAVRDLYAPSVQRVVADSADAAREVGEFLTRYRPESKVEVELYDRGRPLFEAWDVERDYQTLFRTRVPFGPGASIVIHETEALAAIDVNSGRIDRGNLEETALEANLTATAEIARQIRLRDLGGIIVVDYIDMTQAAHRRAVESAFRKAMRRDRARLKIGRLGAFGLLALTRRRQGTGLPRATDLPCRACAGSGSAAQHHAGALRVLRRLRACEAGVSHRLRAHPKVLEHLNEDHGTAVAALPIALEMVADSQLASGDLVLDRR